MALTEAQLRSKREEFWDTAPAFEGKTEIWAALKAAVDAATKEDQVLWMQNPPSCYDFPSGTGTGNT